MDNLVSSDDDISVSSDEEQEAKDYEKGWY